jgi:hypothetical protein
MELDLVKQKEYIIYLTAYKEDKLIQFYKGTFRGHYYMKDKLLFNNVTEKTYHAEGNSRYVSIKINDIMLFHKDVYTFHDTEIVKENAKNAIQRMENRALDMVLKRLVNEHFEW